VLTASIDSLTRRYCAAQICGAHGVMVTGGRDRAPREAGKTVLAVGDIASRVALRPLLQHFH
jgi:succinate dehydrogenase/fumarate reductase-like Fe-S protein